MGAEFLFTLGQATASATSSEWSELGAFAPFDDGGSAFPARPSCSSACGIRGCACAEPGSVGTSSSRLASSVGERCDALGTLVIPSSSLRTSRPAPTQGRKGGALDHKRLVLSRPPTDSRMTRALRCSAVSLVGAATGQRAHGGDDEPSSVVGEVCQGMLQPEGVAGALRCHSVAPAPRLRLESPVRPRGRCRSLL